MTEGNGPLDRDFLPIERRMLQLGAGGQRAFLLLRLILAGVLLLQVFATAPPESPWRWFIAIPLAYAAAAAALQWLEAGRRLSKTLGPATFMLDVGASLSVLRLSEGAGSHVYTALLLLILGSTLLQKPLLIFSVSLTVCLGYAALAFPSPDDVTRALPLHLSLLLLIALFSIHVADYAALIERQTARRYEERLAWMQRLSLVGEGMAAVLHEAKTPLGSIVLNAETAARMLEKGKKPSAELRVIAEEADQAAAILQNFLDFVKPTRLDLKPLKAHEPLLQAIDMMKLRLDEREVSLKLETRMDCPVRGSARHLVQAFTNLLNNAVEAMPSGGRLAVSMEKGGGKVRVRIEDSGVGLSPRDLERLFTPFSTSKPGQEGHGLGLGIVRWIAQEHDGDIELRSAGAGQGTVATLILPLEQKS